MLKDAQLSHAVGGASPELLGLTIPQALHAAVQKWGNHAAVVSVHQDIRWTYAELAEKADAMAAGLSAIGIEKGDRVGIWAPNLVRSLIEMEEE